MITSPPNSAEISVPFEETRSTGTPIPIHSRRSRWDVRPEGIGEEDQIRCAETPDYKYLLAPGVVHPSRSPNGSIGSSLGIRVHFGQPEDSAQRQQQWIEKESQLKEMQADLVRMNERIQEIIDWGNGTYL